MAADGYLRRVLADGAGPFQYRGNVRALLGEPDGPSLLRAAPPAPQPRLSYPRSAWLGEIELPDGIPTMDTWPVDWPSGNDRPRGHRGRDTAAGGISHGPRDEIPEPANDHRPALPQPAVTTDCGPQPGAAAGPSAATELGPAEGPGPVPATPPGPAHVAQPLITDSAPRVAAEPSQIPVAGSGHSERPHAGLRTDAGPRPVRSAIASAGRGPEPAASPGGSRELLIPGRTVRSSLTTGSEEAGTGPDPSRLTSHASMWQPAGPLRPSGAQPAGIIGREPAMTDSSSDRSPPDLGLTVRRIPPRHLGATARKHQGGTVIPDGQATPLHVQRPAGPGRKADIVSADQADTRPPRRPAPKRTPAAGWNNRRPRRRPPHRYRRLSSS